MKTRRFSLSTICLAFLLCLASKTQAFFNPTVGKWASRDPILENGFARATGRELTVKRHLEIPYLFCANAPLNFVDELGLAYGNPISGPDGPIGPADPWSPGGPNWTSPSTTPYGVSYSGCGDALSISDRLAVEAAVAAAKASLDRWASGGLPLGSNLTPGMARCMRGKLDSFRITCASKCNPICLYKNGYTWGGTTIHVCASSIKGRVLSAPVNTIVMNVFHELCHTCGQPAEVDPDGPDSWASWLFVSHPLVSR